MEPRTIRNSMIRRDAEKNEIFVTDCGTHWVAASWDGMETWPLGDPRDTAEEARDDAREAIAASGTLNEVVS